jgi:predicted alpha/beta hydrolase family esterase
MPSAKKQVVVIHGGDTFASYDEYLAFLRDFQIDFERYRAPGTNWKRTLGPALGDDYEVISPDMPDKNNAKYFEWKIWFEKFIPHLDPGVILIGHSLGGIFLVKYLSENTLPKTILATFLVAACYDDTHSDYSLADFVLPEKLDNFPKQSPRIFLYHSNDDKVVPFADLLKYQESLPNAIARTFTDRGHFNQETFPELITDVQSL